MALSSIFCVIFVSLYFPCYGRLIFSRRSNSLLGRSCLGMLTMSVGFKVFFFLVGEVVVHFFVERRRRIQAYPLAFLVCSFDFGIAFSRFLEFVWFITVIFVL